MNKSDIVRHVNQSAEITQAQAGLAVDAVFEAITKAIKAGEDVSIHGFGNFHRSQRRARIGRNPKTGAPAKIEASISVAFKPSKVLKTELNS